MVEQPLAPLPLPVVGSCPFDESSVRERGGPAFRATLPSGEPAWVVGRHADVRRVLGDEAAFSTAAGAAGPVPQAGSDAATESPHQQPGFFLAYEPAEHLRIRRMIAGEFSATRLNLLRPVVESVVAEHLDAVARSTRPVDLVDTFAMPVPLVVICELLGVPPEERIELQRLCGPMSELVDVPERQADSFAQTQSCLREVVRRQRVRPGAGLLGRLISRHGDAVSDEELAGIGHFLLAAGRETTAGVLALGVLALLHHPTQYAALAAAERVDLAVEELLRHVCVVPFAVVRTAVRDVVVDGARIGAGDYVMGWLSSANHDEVLGDGLDRLDVGRGPTPHVAFGYGPHYCVGAGLARLELRIALTALVRRFPTLRLAVDCHDIQFWAHSAGYGVSSLPVTW